MRVAIKMDEKGFFEVFADEDVEFLVVCDHCPDDRVYQMQVQTGVEKMRQLLRDDPVGHIMDDHILGEGYGPRKPPSRPKFKVIGGDE